MPTSLVQQLRSHTSSLRCVLAAAVAWSITVLPIATTGKLAWHVRGAIVASLIPGIVGPLFGFGRLARHLGLTLFLTLVVAIWAWASHSSLLPELDLYRSVLGAVAWGVFALSWTHPWSIPEHQLKGAPIGEASGLTPRRKRPTSALIIALAGVLTAFGCLALAWRVTEPHRAVFAHTIAVAGAISLMTVASLIAVIVGQDRAPGRAAKIPLTRGGLTTLLLLLIIAALTVALHLSESR